VWYAPGDPRNAVCAAPGRQTNNRAELAALLLALCQPNDKPLHVRTDSTYVLGGLTLQHAHDTHLDMWEVVRDRWSQRENAVSHVAAHSGHLGNEAVDRMSKFASGQMNITKMESELTSLYSKTLPNDEAVRAAQTDSERALKQIQSANVIAPLIRPPRQPVYPEAIVKPQVSANPVPAMPECDFHDWFKSRPHTIRSLKKGPAFREWLSLFLHQARGYTASDAHTRNLRLLKLLDLPRDWLAFEVSGKSSKPKTPDAYRGKRMEELTRLQAVGKSARMMAAAEMHPLSPTQDVVEKMRALHPQDLSVKVEPMIHQRPLNLTPQIVHRAVQKLMARGAAPSLDGWTRELLVPIVQDKEALAELTEIIRDLLMNNVSDEARLKLCASPLIALKKPAPPSTQGQPPGKEGIRPIAPESAFIKLASICALALLADAKSKFAPLQHGVYGDVEQAFLLITKKYREHKNLIAIDATNAFNSVSRAKIFAALHADPDLYPIWGLAAMTIGQPSLVCMYDKSELAATLLSSSGVRQGSVLGPILFSLAVQDILVETTKRYKVDLIAYLDDISMAGPGMIEAFYYLETELRKIGLIVNREKTFTLTAYIPGIPRITEVAKVLGGGIVADPKSSENEYRRLSLWCDQHLRKHDRFFERLRSAEARTKVKMMVLRVCGIPRANYLSRIHPAQATDAALTWFDAQVLMTWRSIHQVVGVPLNATELSLIATPCPHGQGLRQLSRCAAEAHEACLSGVKGRQQLIVGRREKAEWEALVPTLSAELKAILLSTAAPQANRVLTDGQVCPSDRAYIIQTMERLGLRVVPGLCQCGEDATNQHVHGCATIRGGAKIHRHNNGMDAMGSILQACGGNVTLEPRQLNMAAPRNRPDIIADCGDQTFVGDLSHRYPASKSTVQLACSTQLHAAEMAEKEKDKAWKSWSETRAYVWAPLVMETTGAMSPRFVEWLRRACISDGPLSVTSSFDAAVAALQEAMLEGTADLFAAAAGLPQSTHRQQPTSRVATRPPDNPFFQLSSPPRAAPPTFSPLGTSGATQETRPINSAWMSGERQRGGLNRLDTFGVDGEDAHVTGAQWAAALGRNM